LGEIDRLFKPIDRKSKLFQRLEVAANLQTVLDFPTLTTIDEGKFIDHPHRERQISVRDLLEKLLLAEYTPTCVVVSEQGQILYIHGQTGKYLQLASGEAELNVLRMAREGLRMPLITAMRKASAQKKDIIQEEVPVRAGDEIHFVKLTVRPLLKPAAMQGLFMIMFEEMPIPLQIEGQVGPAEPGHEANRRVIELEQELNSTREYLQTTIEELETSNEELQATNEELQSSNEELQSTNEELVTAKEELQSINEELMTVNVELETKIEELTLSNSDMINLLASIDVGVVFLDRHLNIRRFNQAATQVFNLIDTDIGRPLQHTTSNLLYDDLLQDARTVLETLVPKKLEISGRDENWYWLRIRPYRTQQDTIAGLVLTCSDITLQKQREAALARSQAFLQTIYHGTSLGVYVIDVTEDGDFRYAGINPAHQRFTGLSDEAVRGKRLEEFGLPPEVVAQVRAHYRRCVETGQAVDYELEYPTEPEQRAWWLVHLEPLRGENGQINRIIGSTFPISRLKIAEEALRENDELLRLALQAGQMRAWDWHLQTDHIKYWGDPESIQGRLPGAGTDSYQAFLADIHPEDREWVDQAISQAIEAGIPYRVEFRVVWPDGSVHWRQGQGQPQRDETTQVVRVVGIGQDVTERKQTELALRELQAQLELILKNSRLTVFYQDQALRYVRVLNPDPGFVETEILGKTDADLFPSAKEVARLTEITQGVLESGVSATTEMSLIREGAEVNYRLVVEPWFDTDGKGAGVTCAAWDITNQKRLEEVASLTN
jgi:PAS domain S-box-containing protein